MRSYVQWSILLIAMTTLMTIVYILLGLSLQSRSEGHLRRKLIILLNDSRPDCSHRVKKLLQMMRNQDKRHRKIVKTYKAKALALKHKLSKVSALVPKNIVTTTCSSLKLINSRDVVNISTTIAFDHQHGSIAEEEEEAIIWENFTRRHFYYVLPGIPSRKPFESYVVRRKSEHVLLLALARNKLKTEERLLNGFIKFGKLADGYSLFERTRGITYVLHYLTNNRNIYKQMEFLKPFAGVHQVKAIDTFNVSQKLINIIITLQGRVERFRVFMQIFVEVCVKMDNHVFLTVVYFGKEGMAEARQILEDAVREVKFANYSFYVLDMEFSRGRGLTHGARMWKNGNVLMFFCDVDMVFDHGFLDRCRWYTSPGGKVYYPVVWSFYNPDFIYANKTEHELFLRTSDTGTWRNSGCGMTCQYRDDFFAVNGFNEQIQGWGLEDVDLYKKFLHSKFQVLRGVDRGIYHMYHSKDCNSTLSRAQYTSCCNSRVRYEASTLNLGLMVLASRERKNN